MTKSGMRRFQFACSLGLAVAMLAPNLALAQTPAAAPTFGAGTDAPAETTATYGNWVLHCVAIGAGAAADGTVSAAPQSRTCEIVQTISADGQSAPYAKLAFGYLPGSDSDLLVTAVLPSYISLPGFAHIAVIGKQSVEEAAGMDLAWSRCVGTACYANAQVDPSVLKAIQHETDGQLRFMNAAGQTAAIPLSWDGFNRALAALVMNRKLQ